jgi:hypothetical protein
MTSKKSMEVMIYLLQIFLIKAYYYYKTFTKFKEGVSPCLVLFQRVKFIPYGICLNFFTKYRNLSAVTNNLIIVLLSGQICDDGRVLVGPQGG